MRAIHSVLEQVDLLQGVDESALRALAEVGRVVVHGPDEFVVQQGDFGDSLFVVLEGQVRVQRAGDDGRMRDIDELGAGRYFGELAMIGHGERVASVKSRTQVELLELRQAPFTRALKRFKKVKTRLEQAYTRRALGDFFDQSRYFHDLPSVMHQELTATSSLSSYTKGDVIAREGDKADRFFIVRQGFVRVSRNVEGADQDDILAYLGVEDFFGDQELAAAVPAYATSVVAVEPVECVTVPRGTFWKLHQRHPQIFAEFRRYQISRRQQQKILTSSNTSMAFIKDMLESGLGQARSALIINLDTCVRCGNCVQACNDLHGYSRIARRGKKMTRRVQMESGRRHESLYFPTSCLQCATPECMVGCPTGAISRDPGGEVFIRQTCIGCGNCARNCDFGNIAMANVQEEFSLLGRVLGDRAAQLDSDTQASDLIAVKCDVCFQRDHAACVYNCPTHAILRIDPRVYFDELRHIAPKVGQRDAAPAKTTTHRPRRWIDGVVQLAAATLSAAGGYALWLQTRPSSWHGLGWYAGVLAAFTMFALGLMGGRKRIRTARIGSLSRWARVHAVLGGLFYGIVLFHAGYQASSLLTATLLAAVTFVCLIGAGGQIANVVVPRMLARTEDESLLPEDVAPWMSELQVTNQQLLDTLEARARRRVEKLSGRLARGAWHCFVEGYGPKRIQQLVEKRAAKASSLDSSEQPIALRVAENLLVYRLWTIRRVLEVLLTSWVPVHLVASCVATLLLLGHLLVILAW